MRRLFPNNHFVAPQLPNPNKDLVRLVIAEAPGEQESLEGQPLVGGSGRVFNSLLRTAHIPREGLTIVNCINCRPPDNIFPTDREARKYISKEDGEKVVRHCNENHVKPILSSRSWNRVDLVGDKALRIVGQKFGGVTKWRGSPLTIPDSNLRAIAIQHPSYLMRDQDMLIVAAHDLMKSTEEPPEFYTPFPSIEDVRNFKFKTFAFDIESPKYRTLGDSAPVEMVGLCGEATKAICVPTRGEYLSELKRIFREAEAVIGHNCIQFDLPKLRGIDIKINEDKCQIWDTMLLQHLVFPSLPHDLEFVGSQFISKPAWKDERQTDGWELYCCRDTDVTFQVWQELLPLLSQHNLRGLYENVQVPLAKICYGMFKLGFKVNPNRIHTVREKLLKEQAELEQRLPDFLRTRTETINKRKPAPPGTLGKSGKPVKYITVPGSKTVIPWRSSAEKQRFLYSNDPGCLGLQPVHDLKSGNITTGKMAIAKLSKHSPAIGALGKLNKIDEIITTFAKTDLVAIDRMYPHFNVHGTSSGRLSSSDPNLQNIPESVRCIYVPSHAEWKIVDVDYSNIENRLTAILAGDTERLAKYEDPKHSDYKVLVHRAYGIPYDEIVKDNSREAPYGKCKAIVLGINYGLGAQKISKMYDIPIKEVHHLLDTWKSEIKLTSIWQQKTSSEAIRTGLLTTPFGRKRWFWTSSAYTESLSFLPQSSAADIIFRAMIGLMYERIDWPEWKAKLVVPIVKPLPKPANLLLQVHDSLVFECPSGLVEELVATVKLVMEQPWKELGGYKIPISVKIGDSWGD